MAKVRDDAMSSKLPPVMGWSTWNQFQQHINEGLILEVAEAMNANGLLDAGYRYINIDDCWQGSQRDKDGRLQFDIGRFPRKEGLIKELNTMGFKVGLYSSCGKMTCEDMPGSYGFEDLDAKTFANWGAEYLKYDYCHVVDLPTDPHYMQENFATEMPKILYIAISGIGPDGYERQFPTADKLVLDVPRGGTYQVAIGYEKEKAHHRKFLLVTANNDTDAQLWFPPTSGWNSPGRITANIELKSGENTLVLTNPIQGQREDSMLRYSRMGKALKNAALPGRPIFYSICEHGRTKPWTWAGKIGSSWRVSHDIRSTWGGIMKCYEATADLWSFQSPGAYNDPDMLEVGIGNLSDTENRSHFILWCMLSAPLILGLDVRYTDAKTMALITNPEIIALNQEGLLLQASRTKLNDDLDLLIKPLTKTSCAVCLFNKSETPTKEICIPISELLKHDERVCFATNGVLKVPPLKAHEVALFLFDDQGNTRCL